MKTLVVCALVIVAYRLARRWVDVEIVHAASQPVAPRETTGVLRHPAWYQEWIVAQSRVRSRYDC